MVMVDDDDAQSMAAVTIRGLEHIDEEDKDGLEQENQQQLEEAEIQDQDAETEEMHQGWEELGRPRTPEPTIVKVAFVSSCFHSKSLTQVT